MRLLNVRTFEFAEFRDNRRPKYVIASHRWVEGSEVTLHDIRNRLNTEKSGYKKILDFALYVRQHFQGVEWLWVDTCCINKDSAAELSEAINLMFHWYRSAELCIALLSDVEVVNNTSALKRSEWFKRGWTLQELLAPRVVLFVTNTWQVIGNKGVSEHGRCDTFMGRGIEKDIAQITGIPVQALHNFETSLSYNVEEKLRWMEGRSTTREEDMSYALYGIFGVTPGANYGERHEGARQRLLAAINHHENAAAQRADRFRQIADWISPPDPWTNHQSARRLHQPQTGVWLIESDRYRAWKAASTRHLWLYGKAGCGKTILCSTVIEDVLAHCEQQPNAGSAIFYFSFSDKRKQSYDDLARSLIVQLGWKEPALSMLRQAYETSMRTPLGSDELQKVLLSCFQAYDVVFLHLDALDECPEDDGVRQAVLERLETLLQRAPNVRTFTTSRDVPDIHRFLVHLGASSISATAQATDSDIQRYISCQLSRNYKLSRLDPATSALVKEVLLQRADGMFRWVYCQLQELQKSKSTRPKSVEAALLALPATLDETYERMLNRIHADDTPHALALLRWLAYAKSPLSLNELAEASLIDPGNDPTEDGIVDIENRGGWGDALDILAGLVSTENPYANDTDDTMNVSSDGLGRSTADLDNTPLGGEIDKDTKVKLAHFSVKEYLESRRILEGSAKGFHLDPAREHRFLTHCCIVYLEYYTKSIHKTLSRGDFKTFPFLDYAATTWFHHASLQHWPNSIREVRFLTTESSMRDWVHTYETGYHRQRPFFGVGYQPQGNALYHASLLGLETVVGDLLRAGADFRTREGNNVSPLQAASSGGHEKVVQMLLDAGFGRPGFCGQALHVASFRGYEKVVRMLLDAGVDVHIHGSNGTPLHRAVLYRHSERIVQMLLDAGADVNAQTHDGDTVLGIASVSSRWSSEKTVQILLDAGANVNDNMSLQLASLSGNEKIVRMLLDAGANVNAQVHGNNTLQAALRWAEVKMIRMMQDAGVNFDTHKFDGDALQVASWCGHEAVVRVLLDAGANVNAQGFLPW